MILPLQLIHILIHDVFFLNQLNSRPHFFLLGSQFLILLFVFSNLSLKTIITAYLPVHVLVELIDLVDEGNL